MVSVPKGSTFISTFPKFKVCMKKLFPFLFFCFFTTLVVAQSNSGKLKYVENANGSMNNNISIDISGLPPGIYTLQTKIENNETGVLTFLKEQFIKI